MVTQSLRGMQNHGPMHWRADRTGGNDEQSSQPDEGNFDEAAAFKKFNGAFVNLLGRTLPLSNPQMQKFTDFILQVTYPPNPIRNLDNSLTPQQQAGRDFFFNMPVGPTGSCGSCHVVNSNANPNEGAFRGFFGTDGSSSNDFAPQILKVVHLRNAYQKVGMFGFPIQLGFLPADAPLGDQVRGTGFLHDGSIGDLFRFASGFDVSPRNPVGLQSSPANTQGKLDMVQYQLVFETNLAPIVGQQITLNSGNGMVVGPRIDLLMQRADAGECELVAKGRIGPVPVGFLYTGNGQFSADLQLLPPIPDAILRASVVPTQSALTYTCTPPGNGRRIGIDRDLDGFLDGDELLAGSSPADPNSTP